MSDIDNTEAQRVEVERESLARIIYEANHGPRHGCDSPAFDDLDWTRPWYEHADAVLAAGYSRTAHDTEGSWVCARCGLAPESHGDLNSPAAKCVYDPAFRPVGASDALLSLAHTFDGRDLGESMTVGEVVTLLVTTSDTSSTAHDTVLAQLAEAEREVARLTGLIRGENLNAAALADATHGKASAEDELERQTQTFNEQIRWRDDDLTTFEMALEDIVKAPLDSGRLIAKKALARVEARHTDV